MKGEPSRCLVKWQRRRLAVLLRRVSAALPIPYASLATARQYRPVFSASRKLLPKPSRVLDWGCGDGHFSYFLLRQGHRVTAYSLQEPPRLFGSLPERLKGRLEFVQGSEADATSLPFSEASFDAAFSVGVLEHVRETGGRESESLLELARVLVPGGRFLCFHLPNKWSWIEGLSRLLKSRPAGEGDAFHRYRYRPHEIRHLFVAAGFDHVQIQRYGALPRNLFGTLPLPQQDSIFIADSLDLVDSVLRLPLWPFVQNFGVITDRSGSCTGSSANTPREMRSSPIS